MYQHFILFNCWIISIVWIYHFLFDLLSLDGHWGHFCLLAIVNNAAMKIHVQVFVWLCIFIFLRKIPKMDLLSHIVAECLTFLRNSQNVLQSCYTISYSHQQWIKNPIPPCLQQPWLLSVFLKIFYLLIFRGERRERGKETSVCGCLSHTYWEPSLQPRHVPWLGMDPATTCFTGWCSIHWNTPARAIICVFYYSHPCEMKFYIP